MKVRWQTSFSQTDQESSRLLMVAMLLVLRLWAYHLTSICRYWYNIIYACFIMPYFTRTTKTSPIPKDPWVRKQTANEHLVPNALVTFSWLMDAMSKIQIPMVWGWRSWLQLLISSQIIKYDQILSNRLWICSSNALTCSEAANIGGRLCDVPDRQNCVCTSNVFRMIRAGWSVPTWR